MVVIDATTECETKWKSSADQNICIDEVFELRQRL
jgi:hypothetical protein